ncbi:hypothetical protein BBI01_06640 [Chryseobacterium artocarpi]|uniref:Uncharacterized protein n=1 Tax=Chryseobacterium artocarpi TaxID=1414727 RepID=A0A1B8ZXR0_9FLAO|nr:hypothetical protein [Chryseobacterium artocarpi]OCA76365.1 hypothetical protein BBI01_06640 [Chryseobacterium artocarpi]
MVTIIIALCAVIILLIQKAESSVSNEQILVKLEQFHFRVKSQFTAIVEAPYSETRQRSTKWIFFLFILIAILHYISVAIFGENSIHNLLSDQKALVFTMIILVIISGHYNRIDMLKVGAVIAFASALTIYGLHNNMDKILGTELLVAELPIGIAWKDAIVILGGIAILTMMIVFVLMARLISFLLYHVIRALFKLCLKLGPKKPLKTLIVIVECLSIVGVAVMSVL